MLRSVLPGRACLVAVALCLPQDGARAGGIGRAEAAPGMVRSRAGPASVRLPQLSVAAQRREVVWDPRICVGCGGAPGLRGPEFR